MNSLFSLLDLDAKAGAPQLVDKTFFMVFFAGDVLRDKISKICTYFGATLYRYPDSGVEHAEMSIQVKKNKRKHLLRLFLNVAPLTFCHMSNMYFKITKKSIFSVSS